MLSRTRKPRITSLISLLARLGLIFAVAVVLIRLATSGLQPAPAPPDEHRPRTQLGTLFYYSMMLFTLAWFMFALAASMYAIAATWAEWWPYTALDIESKDLVSARPAIYAVIGGVIGGTLFSFRGFSRGVLNNRADRWRPWDPSWTIFNISRPVFGAALATIVYAVIAAGIATLGTAATDTKSNVSYFAIGSLAGFGATDAFEWMAGLARKQFARPEENAPP